MKFSNLVSEEALHLALNMARVERHPARAWRAVQLARGAVARRAYQKRSEAAPFLALVARRQPRVVVEIGLAAGGMLWAFCQAASPDATLISVDLPAARHGLQEAELVPLDSVERYRRDRQTLHFVQGDSHAPETVARVRALLPAPIDLLFIDADHTYEAVKADLEMYRPLVAEDGLIALHDILPHDNVPDCQVHLLWAELPEPKMEIVSESEANTDFGGRWGGIGVLPPS